MGEHSKLGASSYSRWKQCPGSVRQCQGIESVSSVYADEGTKAHDIAARVLLGEPVMSICDDPVMAEAVAMYEDVVLTDYINRKGQSPHSKEHLWVEVKVELTDYFPEGFGTSDAIIYDPGTKTLYVYDFKYGSGQHVEVENNLQLQYYALGAHSFLFMLGFDVENIECVIVQPRCKSKKGHVRRWRTHVTDLLLEFAPMVTADAAATRDPKAPLVIGRHCWWCPARTAGCPAHHNKKLNEAFDEFEEVTSDAESLL